MSILPHSTFTPDRIASLNHNTGYNASSIFETKANYFVFGDKRGVISSIAVEGDDLIGSIELSSKIDLFLIPKPNSPSKVGPNQKPIWSTGSGRASHTIAPPSTTTRTHGLPHRRRREAAARAMSRFWRPGSEKPTAAIVEDEEGGVLFLPTSTSSSSSSGCSPKP